MIGDSQIAERLRVPAPTELAARIDSLNDRIDHLGASLDEIADDLARIEQQREDDKRVIDLLSLILIPAGD